MYIYIFTSYNPKQHLFDLPDPLVTCSPPLLVSYLSPLLFSLSHQVDASLILYRLFLNANAYSIVIASMDTTSFDQTCLYYGTFSILVKLVYGNIIIGR